MRSRTKQRTPLEKWINQNKLYWNVHTWSETERNSSRSGSHSTFFGSWMDLDPFLESWNGSGMDLFIQEKNQFSSSLKEQTSPL